VPVVATAANAQGASTGLSDKGVRGPGVRRVIRRRYSLFHDNGQP